MFSDILALEWAKSLQGDKKILWNFRGHLPETLYHYILQKVRWLDLLGYRRKQLPKKYS